MSILCLWPGLQPLLDVWLSSYVYSHEPFQTLGSQLYVDAKVLLQAFHNLKYSIGHLPMTMSEVINKIDNL